MTIIKKTEITKKKRPPFFQKSGGEKFFLQFSLKMKTVRCLTEKTRKAMLWTTFMLYINITKLLYLLRLYIWVSARFLSPTSLKCYPRSLRLEFGCIRELKGGFNSDGVGVVRALMTLWKSIIGVIIDGIWVGRIRTKQTNKQTKRIH